MATSGLAQAEHEAPWRMQALAEACTEHNAGKQLQSRLLSPLHFKCVDVTFSPNKSILVSSHASAGKELSAVQIMLSLGL